MDIDEIMKLLPHRYPFLLVDRVTSIDEKRIEGYKNVTATEPFFQGHFPDYPIMPGVLVTEAMAQLCGVMLMQNNPHLRDKLPLFLGIHAARFRRQVRPGDVLLMTGEILSAKAGFYKLATTAHVGNELTCEATLVVGWGHSYKAERRH